MDINRFVLKGLFLVLIFMGHVPFAISHPSHSARTMFLAGRDQWIMFSMKGLKAIEDYPLGLRFTVLRQTGPQQVKEEADPEATFSREEELHLCFESNGRAYLYLLIADGACGWRLWIPAIENDKEGHKIDAPKSPRFFDFKTLSSSADTSTAQMLLVLSRSPIAALESFFTSGPDKSSGGPGIGGSIALNEAGQSVVADLRKGVRIWNLLAEKVDNAVYVANRKADSDLKIVMDISLAYRSQRKETDAEKP